MTAIRFASILLTLATLITSPALAQRAGGGVNPCGPRSGSVLNGDPNAWLVARVGTAEGRISTFTVIAAYPKARYETSMPKLFLGRPCKFDMTDPSFVAITGDGKRTISNKMKPSIDALIAAINANDASATTHLDTLSAAYERASLNILESGLYHMLAAPVLRARGDYDAGLISADAASALSALLGPKLSRQMDYEVILLNLGKGDAAAALKRFEMLKKPEAPPPPQLTALMEKVSNDPAGTVYAVGDMNLDRAMANALKPAEISKGAAR